MFEAVLCDEAHYLKNPESAQNQSIEWLKSPFTILASTTPIWSSIAMAADDALHLPTMHFTRRRQTSPAADALHPPYPPHLYTRFVSSVLTSSRRLLSRLRRKEAMLRSTHKLT